MKLLRPLILIITILIFSIPLTGYSASDQNRSQISQKQAMEQDMDDPFEDDSPRTSSATKEKKTKNNRNFTGSDQQDDQKQFDELTETDDWDGTQQKIKPKIKFRKKLPADIIVKAEPGDGLVRLTWKIAGDKQRKSGDLSDLTYTISYGLAPGKLKKNLRVGAGTSYIIRDLKNHQVYYMQISSVIDSDGERLLRLKSDEFKVIPVPEDELGSPLEKSFSKKNLTLLDKLETEPLPREMKQFGYEFFRNSAQLSANLDNLPVGGDYIIGPGDSLSITIWGAITAQHELTVGRNGEITIPKVGAVKVWGLSFDQVKETINSAIGRYFKNYEINVTLGRLRTVQVFVVGEVEMPGGYPVSSLATVVHALSAAGGPTKNGSLRSIRLNRKGATGIDIDLYDILLRGDRTSDVRLQNGDTLFVPVIGPVVAIAGEVKRPAIYELKGSPLLPEVIAMAGGVTASGYTARIQVERFSANSSRTILDFELIEGKTAASGLESRIQDRDMIKVFPVMEAVRQMVSLKGNVVRPGEYQFRPGMRVRDIITGFDLLLPESHLESAEITRLVLPDYHRVVSTFNLRNALSGIESDNILLQEQDTIKVFSRWEMQEKPSVIISGQVLNPGKYDFHPGMTIRDLVSAAGSAKRNAFFDTAELSRITVSNDRATSSRLTIDLRKALSGDTEHNLTLQPDDALMIRGILGWSDSTDKFVRLKGEFRYPGVYSIGYGEKMSSVIARAGGFTEKAFLSGAKFTRKSVREDQQKRMDEILVRTEKELLQKQSSIASVASSKEELEATKSALEALQKDVERMKELKAEGRVVIRLTQLNDLKKSSYDLEMEGGDSLEIPPRPNVVTVLGQVYNPTSFVHLPESSTVENYLNKSGGPTRDAEASDIYLIKADGTVFSRQQSSFGIKWSDESRKWSFGSFLSSFMDPGDTLVVPQKIERTAWLRDIKDITTILSQIALTAGTVLVGLR